MVTVIWFGIESNQYFNNEKKNAFNKNVKNEKKGLPVNMIILSVSIRRYTGYIS